MSKVIIITNHWMEETLDKEGEKQPMKASLFREKLNYTRNIENSISVFAQMKVSQFLKFCDENERMDGLTSLLNLKNTDEDLVVLSSIVKSFLDEDYGDEDLRSLLKSDIDEKNRDGLLCDILNAIVNAIDNSPIYNKIISVIAHRMDLQCYYKKENVNNEDYVVIGVPCLEYEGAGVGLYQEWIQALLKDFTQPNDHVLLALHRSTDWKDPKAPLGREKTFTSLPENKNIKVFLFYHEKKDPVGYVLTSENESLAALWNKLDTL